MSFLFDSQIEGGSFLPIGTTQQVKEEPMLYQCDLYHARQFGGPLTHAFLDSLRDGWQIPTLRVDSRTHMLMPGWFPCIPGWHHDDVPRERSDGQPNYTSPSYHAQHAMALWGDASLTQFATGKADFPDVPIGAVYYKAWHPVVEAKITENRLHRISVAQRQIIYFDWNSWHQGTAATKSGWRFFIRATRYSLEVPKNERRLQTQVYLPAVNEGW